MVTSLHLNSFLTPQGGKGEGPAGGVLSRAERQGKGREIKASIMFRSSIMSSVALSHSIR